MASITRRLPAPGPPTFGATAESLVSDAKRIIAETARERSLLTQNVSPSAASFETVLLPLAQVENKLLTAACELVAYEYISPDSAVRAASAEVKRLLAAFKTETAMNDELFGLVDALQRDPERTAGVDAETRRFLEKVHHDHAANGLMLPPGSPERARFRKTKARLSELEPAFLRDLNEAKSGKTGLWFTRAELTGMPESFLARLETREEMREGEEGETKTAKTTMTTLLRVTLSGPDYFPVLCYCSDAGTRERVFRAVELICAASLPTFREVVVLRDEAARLLGFPNHAAFRTGDKMAGTPEAVDAFLGQLRAGMEELTDRNVMYKSDLKRRDLENRGLGFDGRLWLWDDIYYGKMALKEEHGVDHQLISEYFALEAVVPGMLDMMQGLLGFRFQKFGPSEDYDLPEGSLWHEDVELFGVWNSDDMGGEFVGYLYLDVLMREGKPSNPCSINLAPSIQGQHPITALLCSFAKPTERQPTLLRHDEVVVLFHELGHCIHDLASKTKYARLHGPEGTAGDFCETPSQLLEYWFWTPSVLCAIGRHYSYLRPEYLRAWEEDAAAIAAAEEEGDDTSPLHRQQKQQPPERLPETIVDNLVATKNVDAVLVNSRQLVLSLFDMAVHSPSSREELQKMDMSSLYNGLKREVCKLVDPSDRGEGHSWGHGFATYPHMMDGYDAGFYNYFYSKVFAADMFHTKFATDPMNSEEGRRYRRAILAGGGSRTEMEMLTSYLGRSPRVDAFYHELGLTQIA